MSKTARRDAGSGSVFQRHEKRYGCPPIEIFDTPDGPQKARPAHRCKAPWVAMVELGWEKGKRRRKLISGKDKPAVVAKLRAFRETQAQKGGSTATGVPKLEVWLDKWITDIAPLSKTPKTLLSYKAEIKNHIVPFLGHKRLDKIEPIDILDWHKKLRREPVARPKRDAAGNPIPELLAESSVLKAHAVLSSALGDAATYLRITVDAAKVVDRPGKKPKHERRPLTTDEAMTVLRAVTQEPGGSRWAAAIMLGTRQGETLGLEWSRVDLVNNWVDMSWQLQRVPYAHGCSEGKPCGRKKPGNCPDRRLDVRSDYEYEQITGGLCLVRPKNERPRAFPMPPHLLAWLRLEHGGVPRSRFVWHRADGRPIDLRDDHDEWKSLLGRLGLPTELQQHQTRHTTATILQRLGVPEAIRMAIMGHSVAATQRGYAYVDEELKRAAMNMMGEALALEAPELIAITST